MNTFDGYKENNIMILSLMRLADVYLMYAEATAVGYNSPKGKAATYSLTAEEALNKIREGITQRTCRRAVLRRFPFYRPSPLDASHPISLHTEDQD